jgi:hypothetical protein
VAFFGGLKVMRARHPNSALLGLNVVRGPMCGHQRALMSPTSGEWSRPQEFLAKLATWLPDNLLYAVVIRPMH